MEATDLVPESEVLMLPCDPLKINQKWVGIGNLLFLDYQLTDKVPVLKHCRAFQCTKTYNGFFQQLFEADICATRVLCRS